MAGADHRHGVAGPARTQEPRITGTVCAGLWVGRGGFIGGGRPVDQHVGTLGVFLTAHPRLGAGGRWPGGPFNPAMAPATAVTRGGRRMGRVGADPADLHPVRPGHPLPRDRGAAARAWHRAGDRRRLCHRPPGSRSRVVPAGDARDRPSVVLVVSVALAGAATDAAVAGRSHRPAGAAGRNPGLRRTRRDHDAPDRKSQSVRRHPAPVGEGQPGAGRGRQRGRGVRVLAAAHRDTGAGRPWGSRREGENRRATFGGLPNRQAARSRAAGHRSTGCARRKRVRTGA